MERNMHLQDARPRLFLVLHKILGALFGLFFGLMLLFSLTAAGERTLWMLLFLGLSVPALWLLGGAAKLPAPSLSQPVRWALLGFGGVLLLAAQARFAIAIYGRVDYDFSYVYYAAQGLFLDGDLAGQEGYFAQFPNNLLLTFLFAFVMKCAAFVGVTNFMAVLTACSMAAVDLSIALACLCAKKLWGLRAAWLTLGFGVPLCVLHYGIACPYSDTFGMVFPVLFLFLRLYGPRRGWAGAAVMASMGLLAAAGYKIKPQTILILPALALVELCCIKPDRPRLLMLGRRLLCFGLGLAIGFAGVNTLARALTREVITEQMLEERETPFTHYLMMGCNPETGGFFSTEDYEATLAQKTQPEKRAFNLQVTARRLGEMGPAGYLEFLIQKGRKIFQSAYMDMWVRGPFSRDDGLSVFLQETLCQGGSRFPVYQQLLQALLVILLGLWVLPVALCPKGYEDWAGAVLRLEVMGFGLFQLLFEGGARYRFHQTPVFILLGVWGMGELAERWREIREARKEPKPEAGPDRGPGGASRSAQQDSES